MSEQNTIRLSLGPIVHKKYEEKSKRFNDRRQVRHFRFIARDAAQKGVMKRVMLTSSTTQGATKSLG